MKSICMQCRKEIDKNNPFRWVSDSTSTTSFPTTITTAENIKVSY